MANVLVDTSVWVNYFRGLDSPSVSSLDRLLEENQVVLCGIVELELLQGARPEEKNMLRDLLSALPYVETEKADFQNAGEILSGLRTKGFQVPATDGLIASLCARHHLTLLTLDKHFDHFHQVKRMKV